MLEDGETLNADVGVKNNKLMILNKDRVLRNDDRTFIDFDILITTELPFCYLYKSRETSLDFISKI